MRRLRILITLFSLAVFVVFGFNLVREYLTSDYVAPVITAESNGIEVSVTATDEELMAGMTAQDNLDGDVTHSLFVVSKSKFIRKGVRRINYAAFDKNNNVGVYARELVYTDYVSPRFLLLQPLHFMADTSSPDYLQYIQAYDCLDGDITAQIRVTTGDRVSVSDTVSERIIDLQVTNSAGDTAVLELTASLEDYNTYYQQTPALSEYLIYTKTGEKPIYSSYLVGILSGDKTKAFKETSFDPFTDVNISDGGVNYNVPGVYTVDYRLSRELRDGGREPLGTTKLIVVVEG